jgi:Ca-activated chloride channel family protein
LFLTDGLPTAGETRELSIADNCRQANTRRARVFCFGVGYDVNSRLLDRLSGGNSGTSEYVKPDEDIETHVGRFYAKMTSPVLSDIRLELAGIDINRTYPRDLPDLFEGGQIVWTGRYRQSGKTTIRLGGKVGGERRSLEFPAELAGAYRGTTHDFIERLWVVRRLGDLIDQIDLHGQNKELVDELVALSTKYGILTPYTSFLADERVQLHARLENTQRTRLHLESLNEAEGQLGVTQRDFKQAYMKAARAPDAAAQAADLARAQQSAVAGRLVANNPNQAQLGVSSPSQRGAARSGMGGMGGGSHVAAFGSAMVADRLAEAQQSLAGKVRQIGSKTFYWKNNRWFDSEVKPDEDAKAIVVTQLSDEYFQLARTQKAEYNQYMSQAEPVTVKLEGKVYHVEPVKSEPTR